MSSSRQIFTTKASKAYSMVELLVVLALLVFVMAAVFRLLLNAQGSFFNADTAIEIRSNLRLASEKIAMELRNTGYKGGVAQFALYNGTGVNGTDILVFSVPILCSSTATLLDGSGNPSYWGAPLTWGCNIYTCMDANSDCNTLEYKYVRYALNASNQLERKVLASNGTTVVNNSTTIIGNNITDFQITLSADTYTVTFTLTGQKKSPTARTVTAAYATDVLLNNLEG